MNRKPLRRPVLTPSISSNTQPLSVAVRAVVETLEQRTMLAGDGLSATYYDNAGFTGTSVSRLDPTVNFDWGTGSPHASIGVDTFSARWTGQVESTVAGTYTFTTTSDDGVRLWVNGVQLVNNWTNHAPTANSGTIVLAANTRYAITMEYYENGGGAVAKLSWTPPGGTSGIIPQANLYGATTIPNAPTALNVTAFTHNQITLGWTDNATNEGSFKIERRLGAGGAWSQIGTAAMNAATFTDTGLSSGARYYYRVRATNGMGDSAYTNEANAATQILITALPTADAYVRDGNFGSDVYGTTSTLLIKGSSATGFSRSAYVKFDLTGVDLNGSAKLRLYGAISGTSNTNVPVYAYGVSNQNWTEATVSYNNRPVAGTTAVASATIVNNVNRWYEWDVTAYVLAEKAAGRHVVTLYLANTGGNINDLLTFNAREAASNKPELRVLNTVVAPAVPTGLAATTVSASQINLTWTDASTNEDEFFIERKLGSDGVWGQIASVAAGSTSYSDTGLSPASQYAYRVRSSNAGGYSAYTAEAAATTLPLAPAAPTGLTATTGAAWQINLGWTDASTNETAFHLERKTGEAGAWAEIATLASDTTTYNDTGLSADTAYYYRVRASNTGGNSVYSAEATATTLPLAPAAPSNLAGVAPSTTQINLTWADNANNETGFKLQRKTGIAGAWSQIATPTANATSYADAAVVAGTQYYYRILATNTGGDSAYSAEASVATQGAVTTLSVTADSFVRDGTYGADVYGSGTALLVKGSPAVGFSRESYVKFDLTSVSVIGAAKLRLFGGMVGTTNTNVAIYAYGVSSQAWTEATLSYNNRPAAGATAIATATILDSVNRWYEWDVTAYVQAEKAAGRNVVTINLANTGGNINDLASFNSRESASNGPQILVTTEAGTPAAPSSLSATPTSASQVNLAWADNSAIETGYLIERKTGAGGTWAQIASIAANSTSYSNTGLSSLTEYVYRVRATTATTPSAYSNEATATTALGAPAAPSGLSATPVSVSQINLTWTDNANSESGFKLERKTGVAGAWAQIATPSANATSYNNTGLATATQYYYRLRATNAGGDSAYSNEISATTQSVAPSIQYSVVASSYLGANVSSDAVRATLIQSDGTIVLLANIGSATPGGITGTLVNGATSSTSGAMVRLSSDGKVVLSVTRFAAEVWDASLDASDNIYIAARTDGLIKLNAAGSAMLWKQTGFTADRVDAATNGDVAVLQNTLQADGYTPQGQGVGTMQVFSATGTAYGAAFGAHNQTWDIAIDATTSSVFTTGHRQWSGPSGNPVQVSFVRSQSYTGTINWNAYDWTGTQVDDSSSGGTGPTNNMADTRGLRLDMGADGKLYVAFLAAGGNHIFRYDPFNLSQQATIVGGDQYHSFANSSDEHKTFFARYNASTGAYLAGQQLTARLQSGAANTAYMGGGGDIQADAQGRIYLTGVTASGGGSNNTLAGLPYTFNPVSGSEYGGGPFLLVMSSDFTSRLFVGRVTSSGTAQGVAVRTIGSESTPRIVYGGFVTGTTLWTQNAIQPTNGGGQDGNFVVLQGATAAPVAPSALNAVTSSSSQIALSWSDNSNNEASFVIERRIGLAGAWGTLAIVGTGNSSYLDGGLTAGTEYYYRVRARNVVGDSSLSNESSATTLAAAAQPAAPSATTVVASSAGQITVSWTDNANNETGFKIERQTGAGGTWTQIGTVNANVTSYSDAPLTPETTYGYRVRATNDTGDSAYAAEASATTRSITGTGNFIETGGTVVIEAEHYMGAAQSTDNLSWSGATTTTGYNGEGYITTLGVQQAQGTWATGAEVSYNVTFATTGSYAVYWRRYIVDQGTNSAFAGLDGVATSAYDNSGANLNTWVWVQVGNVNVSSTGQHIFQIRRREPGYRIDRVVLTKGAAPTGNGPAESAREAGTVTIPASPAGVSAAVVSSTRINLTWADSAANEDYYRIERKTGAAGTWTQIATAAANVISYADTGLSPGTQYVYRVRASNTSGDSGYSGEASATTVPLAPVAPTGLSAIATSPSQVTLSWTDNSNNEASFKIERKTGAGGTWVQIGNAAANTAGYIDNGLAPSTQYFYRIRATNTGGDSAYANEVGAATPAPTTAPASPSALAAVTSASNQINLFWTDNANSEDGFKIERKTGAGGTWAQIGTTTADVSTYSDIGLTASTQYYYRVRAYNVIGDSSYSGEANSITAAPAAPVAPSSLRVTGGWSTSVVLAWNDLSGNEQGFRIERSTNGVDFSQIATAAANARAYTDTTTAANTSYHYRIRAYNNDGNSGYSNVTQTATNLGSQIIIDNPVFGGDWNGSSATNAYNSTFSDDKNANKGTATASYVPNVPVSGSYDLYLWNVPLATNAINTPVEINSADGQTILTINQRTLGAKWNYLGTFTFNPGAGNVVIRNLGTTGYVIADAIRWVSSPAVVPAVPTTFTATADNSSRINLSWVDISNNEAGYVVERSIDGTNFTELAVLGPNATAYASTGLTPLTTYYYRVRAFNSIGASPFTPVVSASTADEAVEHLRLFVTPAQITQLKQQIQVAGSSHQEMFLAMKARVDANDWRAYDTDINDGGKGYSGLMRTYLARENAMMYLLTDNALYAQQAYDALFQVYASPDSSGVLPDSGSVGLLRAMQGEGFAMAYDWCYAGWNTTQRDWVRGKIRAALDAWPSYNHVNFSNPYASNWNAVCRSGELIMMLSIPGEEVSRADRFAQLKSWLIGHINTAYGASGWSQEGIGYAAYGLTHLIPAINALHSIGDTSLDTAFYSKSWWRLYMTTGSFTDQLMYPQTGVDAGVEGNLNGIGIASLLLSTVPSGQASYYRWWYDHHVGSASSLPSANRYDSLRAGTVWAMLYYPASGTSIDPDNNISRTIADDARGAYFFRNTWNDANDIIVSSMSDARHDSRAWEVAEAFNIGLIAYDTRFFGGVAKTGPAENNSTLLVDGNDQIDSGDTGSTEFYSSQANGSGYLIANGGLKYQRLGLTSAKRHTLVDFSGVAAPLVMSTLDQLQSGTTHTYTWNLNLGDEIDNDNIAVDIGSESGVSTFVLHGANNSYVKGWVMTGGTLSGPGAAVNGSLKIDVTGANTDIWVVMVVGQGTAPTGAVSGSGMSSTLTVNGRQIYYNAATNRIVS